MRQKIEIGDKFNRLRVLKETPLRNSNGEILWECICCCGNNVTVSGRNLRSNRTKSCGCLLVDKQVSRLSTHHMSKSKVHRAWTNIKSRCYNPNNTYYHRYGGRGIKMHEPFKESFEAFYAEIGDPPEDSYKWSVDRIDNQKGYEPGNMRWATAAQQVRNQCIRSNNKSGVVGVYYKTQDSREYWVARCTSIEGKGVSVYFNIAKYGYEEAFKLACECRERMMEGLQAQGAGYGINHGKTDLKVKE